MEQEQNCVGILGHLFGHKFRARYTRKLPDRMVKIEVRGGKGYPLLENHYEKDVCERCGKTVTK